MTSLTASASFVSLPSSSSSSSRLPPCHNLLLSFPIFSSFVSPDIVEEEYSPDWPKIRRARRGSFFGGSGWSTRRRKKVQAAEAEDAFTMDGSSVDLEGQVFEFMRSSQRPNHFPTKDELIAGGRADLAEAISKHGGWLAFGWDLDHDKGIKKVELEVFLDNGNFQSDGSVHQARVSDCPNAAYSSYHQSEYHSTESFSGRSSEMENIEDSGIEGIIKRLEKERSLAFGMDSEGKGAADRTWTNAAHDPGATVLLTRKWTTESAGSNVLASNWNIRTAASESDETFSQNPDSCSAGNENLRDVNVRRISSLEIWRNRCVQGLGFPDRGAEIPPVDAANMLEHEHSENPLASDIEFTGSTHDKNNIRVRLQHLEAVLASALHLLRSRTKNVNSDEGHERSVDELHTLSDAWEFRETEILSARDKLRSIRAKLAILEGKMALQMIQAQRILEEKQRRINASQHALSLLRTVCIVWPNNASEVLLVGSFDGWKTQRQMERSDSGIFSLHLKLYPGRYEIKFIVDGSWKVDPLRPTVQNNDHENNLLFIT